MNVRDLQIIKIFTTRSLGELLGHLVHQRFEYDRIIGLGVPQYRVEDIYYFDSGPCIRLDHF